MSDLLDLAEPAPPVANTEVGSFSRGVSPFFPVILRHDDDCRCRMCDVCHIFTIYFVTKVCKLMTVEFVDFSSASQRFA